MYRTARPAPLSKVPAERRGAVVARFCWVCGSFYPLHAARHLGKPLEGKDHVVSPCTQEGRPFAEGEDWWEPAVEVLQAPLALAS